MGKLTDKRRNIQATCLFCIFLFPVYVSANNISISNVDIPSSNLTSNYAYITFDITWENSWRTSSAPDNWDAAWVFLKFKVSGGNWTHCTLNYVDGTAANDGHYEPSGSTIETPDDGKGIFIYRSANGTGTVNFTNVWVRWNYGTDGVADLTTLDINVYGIEMVYVPQGSFYVGDGSSDNGQFAADNTTSPFQITGEGSLTLGGTPSGNLGSNDANGYYTSGQDDFDFSTTKTLPAAFPKGYNAFYIGKYEISQGEYTEFLNSLTRTQQNARTHTDVSADAPASGNIYVMTNTSSVSARNTIRCPASGNGTTDPIIFSCATPYRTANRISLADMMAYLDWAGLRPITELEFEKAGRGPSSSVANEYAWGSTSITCATGISSDATTGEKPSNSPANCICDDDADIQGPMRGGAAYSGGSRSTAGTSYYGVMNLTGNVFDRCVGVGNAHNRAFTGLHGNGAITAAGAADVSNWVSTSSTSRGGSWVSDPSVTTTMAGLRLSDRCNGVVAVASRANATGGRSGRTAP